MRKQAGLYFLSLACLLSVSVACCSELGQLSSTKQDQDLKIDCTDQVICTEQFDPHQCLWNGQTFQGSNRCHAMAAARAHACTQQLAFDEQQVVCTPTPAPADVRTKCEEATACTREYIPHVCSYGDEKYWGPNRCEAKLRLKKERCLAGKAPAQVTAIVCEETGPEVEVK